MFFVFFNIYLEKKNVKLVNKRKNKKRMFFGFFQYIFRKKNVKLANK